MMHHFLEILPQAIEIMNRRLHLADAKDVLIAGLLNALHGLRHLVHAD